MAREFGSDQRTALSALTTVFFNLMLVAFAKRRDHGTSSQHENQAKKLGMSNLLATISSPPHSHNSESRPSFT